MSRTPSRGNTVSVPKGIHLVKSHSFEKWVDSRLPGAVLEARAQFGGELEVARAIYRKYPDLITADRMAQQFRDAIREYFHCEPNDRAINVWGVDDDLWLSPKFEESIRAELVEMHSEIHSRKGKEMIRNEQCG